MYEPTLSSHDFLIVFYKQMGVKLKRVILLLKKKKKILSEAKEIYEIKDKLISALDMLSMSSTNIEFKHSLESLAVLIVSENIGDIEFALKFCTEGIRG